MDARKLLPVFAVLLCSATLQAQSLGDIARQQRDKQAQKPAAPRKVITDDDMPSHPAEAEDSSKTADAGNHGSAPPIDSASNGEKLKAAFLERKQQIKNFEQQLNGLKASVHYVEANRYS